MSDYSMTEPLVLNSIRTFKARVDRAIDSVVSANARDIFAYKKRGGLHFAKVGDVSVSWSVKRKPVPAPISPAVSEPAYTVNLESRISRFVR